MGVITRMICLMLILTGGLMAGTQLQAQDSADGTSRDQLRQLTAQLQQSPGDQALREKIIALALTISRKPETPDGAIMAEGAAEYAFKNAKSSSDFSDSAKQYEKALVLAPWLAADYFNCGVAHEKAGENKEAIRSFSTYLIAAPNADDALAVKKRIGGLQYAAQKAEVEANRPALEAAAVEADARRADERAGFTDNLDGTVTDLKSGWMWQQRDDGNRRSWSDSVSYCGSLYLGNHRDWHLPDNEELASFWTNAGSKAEVQEKYFPREQGFYYWSSTEDGPPYAYRMYGRDGDLSVPGKKTFTYYVRCVRLGR
jgi:tetratricopeptide (TPR) repeat protein